MNNYLRDTSVSPSCRPIPTLHEPWTKFVCCTVVSKTTVPAEAPREQALLVVDRTTMVRPRSNVHNVWLSMTHCLCKRIHLILPSNFGLIFLSREGAKIGGSLSQTLKIEGEPKKKGRILEFSAYGEAKFQRTKINVMGADVRGKQKLTGISYRKVFRFCAVGCFSLQQSARN